MTTPSPKKQLFEQLARVGKAVSHSNRLELLEFLAQGEKSVEALANVAGLSLANTSQHLQNLRSAGLVNSRKSGQKILYKLSDESVVDLLNLLRMIAEKNIAEVEQLINLYLKSKDNMEPVPARELLKRAKNGLVTVLDVRPPDEYAAGHIPGAINVAVRDLEKFIKEIDSDKEIVAYCRGAYCLMSYDAVVKLRKKGFQARRLEEGFPEWKRAGLPVDKR